MSVPDIWHAGEHLWDVAAKLFPSDEKFRKSWAKKLIKKLNRGRVEAVVTELRSFPTRKPELRDILRIEADYFERNRERMRYPRFRKLSLFFVISFLGWHLWKWAFDSGKTKAEHYGLCCVVWLCDSIRPLSPHPKTLSLNSHQALVIHNRGVSVPHSSSE